MSSPPTAVQKAPQAAWDEMSALLGGERLRPATAGDAIDGVAPAKVAEPSTQEQVAQLLSAANQAGLAVIPRGGASKIGWGNPPRRADLVLSLARMNKVLEHAWADMTASVEAGCSVAELQSQLAQHGQRLAIDSLWPERATIGGILATNNSGALRVRYGSLRDLIIGITIVLPDGTVARSGGKVVKNVAGYDLPKLITGSCGTLGVITQAIFRLHPLPRNSRTVTFETATADGLCQLLLSVLASQLAFTGLQFRVGSGMNPQLDIRFDGTPAGIDAQEQHARKLASNARQVEAPGDPWKSAEAAWSDSAAAIVAKSSVLPAHLANLSSLAQLTSDAGGLKWRLVAQGGGIGWLRLDGPQDALLSALPKLRAEVSKWGGSLVCYGCPTALKSRLDPWGPTGDSLPLMWRVKAQFDPVGILNPGRFVGGI